MSHARSRAAAAAAPAILLVACIAAAALAGLAVAACGGDSDFPGSWVSVRNEHVVIAARDDGDYDVTFKDPDEQRGEDMTFTLARDGDRLVLDIPEDDFFIYVTLGGDKITIERIGNIQTYLREE